MKNILSLAILLVLAGCASKPIRPQTKISKAMPAVSSTEVVGKPLRLLWDVVEWQPRLFFRVYKREKFAPGYSWVVIAEVTTNSFDFTAEGDEGYFQVSAVHDGIERFAGMIYE